MAISGMCLLFLLVTSGISVVNNTDTLDQCIPFKALFIFDKNQFDQSFFNLRNFMITCVQKFSNETLINVITIGDNKTDKFEFTKMAGNESWQLKIGHEAHQTNYTTIKHTTISDAIFDFFDRSECPKMAEILYLFVNEKTVIDDVDKVKIALEKKKRFIVLYGEHTEGDVWTELSMDEKHIKILAKDEEFTEATVNSVAEKSCFDSKLVCDTDEYWNKDKKACYPCSIVRSDRSFCSECPYDSSKADDTDLSTSSRRTRQIKRIEDIGIGILICIIINICISVYQCCKEKIHRLMSYLFERRQTYSKKEQNGVEERLQDTRVVQESEQEMQNNIAQLVKRLQDTRVVQESEQEMQNNIAQLVKKLVKTSKNEDGMEGSSSSSRSDSSGSDSQGYVVTTSTIPKINSKPNL